LLEEIRKDPGKQVTQGELDRAKSAQHMSIEMLQWEKEIMSLQHWQMN